MSALGSGPERPRRRGLRTAKVLLSCVLVAVLGIAGLALVLQERLAGHLYRVDGVFSGLSHRPHRPSAGHAARAVNILVLTVDHGRTSVTGAGVPAPSWLRRAHHIDSALVLHLDGDRRAGSAVAVPLETWVDIPGRGPGELGAALSDDNPSLAIATVEKLTDVRIDHLAAFDWTGLAKLTDAAGGVILNIPLTVRDPDHGRTWTAGVYTADGAKVLAYVGQRRGLAPDPVTGQTMRLQYLMRELMDDTLHQEFRKQPFALYRVLDTVSRNLAVESGWSSSGIRNLALSLRNLRSASIDYLTVPMSGPMTRHGRTVVALDATLNAEMWRAVRADDMAHWVADHEELQVPLVVR